MEKDICSWPYNPAIVCSFESVFPLFRNIFLGLTAGRALGLHYNNTNSGGFIRHRMRKLLLISKFYEICYYSDGPRLSDGTKI